MAFQLGDRVGDYQIIQVLGAGGMGQVYKVRNVISERVEAMKILLPNLESNQELADRFLREIKVQASLEHPNIASLHTAQRVDNQLLMIMEYVEGESLDRRAERGRIPIHEGVDYIMQVLLALAYAHSRGVVHRDIKPANMMVTPKGVVKLMDFGIAKMAADRRLTQTGRTVGSLFYMSPEQIKGQDPDPRSDLYSLGVALYEIVTGTLPFKGDSDYTIMAAHLQQSAIPPIEVDPRFPTALNEVIMMSIAKDPGQRFQSADAFRGALENASRGIGIATDAPAAPQYSQQQQGPPQQSPMYQPPQANFQPPMPAPPQPSSSHRGLYMVLGSLATIGVLALAITQGPRLWKTYAGTKTDQVATNNPISQGTGNPLVTPIGETKPQQNIPQSGGNAERQPPQKEVIPEKETQQNPPSTDRVKRTGAEREIAQNRQPRVDPYQARQDPPPQQYQQQQQQQQQQDPPRTPQVDPATTRALHEAREQYNQMAIRAESSRGGVKSMEQQLQQQGLGLRGDIKQAETRVNYLMQEAMTSIQAGDPAAAKKHLDMAELALESVERFLGR